MCKISILIPSYKPSDYITWCLKSIESQTLDKSLFKVYIALNGSDKSFENYLKEILTSFTFKHELFFLKQAGVSNARNVLIDKSTEEFVVFVDDDDLLSENYLEELLQASSDKVVGITNVFSFVENLDDLKKTNIGSSFPKLKKYTTSKFKSRKYYSFPVAKMLHRQIIDRVRFDTKLEIGEDSLFMAQLSNKVHAMQKTSATACYYVYERKGSATRQEINKKKEFKRIVYLLKEYSKMLLDFRYDTLFVMTRIAATLMHMKKLF